MYVSGVPGTGKSLTLRELQAAAGTWGNPPPRVAAVNCMGLPDAREARCRAACRSAARICAICAADP
jgi:hypothetical protein